MHQLLYQQLPQNAQEAYCLNNGYVATAVSLLVTQDNQESSKSSCRSDYLSNRPAGSKKRKMSASDFENKIIDCLLDILAEEQEILEEGLQR